MLGVCLLVGLSVVLTPAVGLQAVRTMAERGHTNNPAQLLQSVCNEVQRQEEYPPLRQGPYPLAAEPYVSRAVTPTPELPFSAPINEPPFDPPMFRGVQPFSLTDHHAAIQNTDASALRSLHVCLVAMQGPI